MKKKVFRERYSTPEPTVKFIEEPTEEVADVVIEKPKTTRRKTTKKGKK